MLENKKIHLIGIGGCGMSGLASLLLDKKNKISGSDINENRNTERLKKAGVEIFLEHAVENVAGCDLVVVSSAILEDNPELMEAKKRNITVLKRAEMLANLMEGKKKVVVGGTHGKTTTVSLIISVLEKAGKKPCFAIGGDLVELDTNSKWGEGKCFVVEGDESDGTITSFSPDVGVITNIEEEHMNYFNDIGEINTVFKKFANNISSEGKCYCYYDDENVRKIMEDYKQKIIYYGRKDGGDIKAVNIIFRDNMMEYDFIYFGKRLGKIRLNLLGIHNVINSLPAVGIGLEEGIDFRVIQNILKESYKVRRRLDFKFRNEQLVVVDDYAHHPTEVKATLESLKALNYKRLVVVFQPHRYTRMNILGDKFVKALKNVNMVFVTDIYSAGEEGIEGVHSKFFCDELQQVSSGEIVYVPDKNQVLNFLESKVQEGDIIVLLGAGDLYLITASIVKFIKNKFDKV